MFRRPFSAEDLTSILKTWATFIPVQVPAHLYIGGSSALLLCATFSDCADIIADRRADDIDYYATGPKCLLEHAVRVLENGIEKEPYVLSFMGSGLEKLPSPFNEAGGQFFESVATQRNRDTYFYTPSQLNDPARSGLAIHVLKEGYLLTLKIMEASLHRASKDIADVSRLCAMLNIGDALSLQKIWTTHKRILKDSYGEPFVPDFSKQWGLVEKLRSGQAIL